MEHDQVDRDGNPIKFPTKPPTSLQKLKFNFNRVNNNLKYGFGTNTPLQMGVGTDMYNTLMTKKEKRAMELTEAVTNPLALADILKSLIKIKKKEIKDGSKNSPKISN